MFGRRRNREPWRQEPQFSAHPIDLLVTHNANRSDGDKLFQQMALDFLGGGVTSSPASVRAAKRPPTPAQRQLISDVVLLVFEALEFEEAAPEGRYQHPPAFAALVTFTHEMNKILGSDNPDSAASPLRRAIAMTTGAAVSSLRTAGRIEDALAATLAGGCLYLQADSWMATR
jgi:hypothetical protein